MVPCYGALYWRRWRVLPSVLSGVLVGLWSHAIYMVRCTVLFVRSVWYGWRCCALPVMAVGCGRVLPGVLGGALCGVVSR